MTEVSGQQAAQRAGREVPSRSGRWRDGSVWRGLAIVAIFTLVGPPVAAVTGAAALGLVAMAGEVLSGRPAAGLNLLFVSTFAGTVFALPIAVAFGGLPAFLVGLAVAFRDRRCGGVPGLPFVLGASLVSWLGMVGALLVLGGRPGVSTLWIPVLLVVHGVCAVTCRAIVRRLMPTGRAAA